MNSTVHNYFDIGEYQKLVSTKSTEAQLWINRGLMNLYGFNHFAAIKCFLQAAKQDENCCFAYWGIAYAYGPHYNAIQISLHDYEQGLKYLAKADQKKEYGNQLQKSLIEATGLRYPKDFKQFENQCMKAALQQTSLKMKELHIKFPNDVEVAALYAESLMNLNPWKLWSKDGQPTTQAILARQVLQKYIKYNHPFISHLYIHLMELSPFFRQTQSVCDYLFQNTKGIAHLLHMPSHIYIQIGDYLKSLQSNVKAVKADFETKRYIGDEISFYEFYRAHNAHFAVWAAMFLGDYETAMHYSQVIKQVVNIDVVDVIGRQAQFYVSTQLHVMIRFGKWKQILAQQLQTRHQYPLYITTQRYSRTIAYAVLGHVKQAEQQLALFRQQRSNIASRHYSNNTCQDVFAVAQCMAMGELYYRMQKYEQAFQCLRKSVQLSDNLVYDEPWGWMQPPRHALAALLLEQEHFELAQKVYLEDLKIYPNNIWSLTGLDEIYRKCSKHDKLSDIGEALQKARKQSKQNINASCFCKTKTKYI